MLDAVGQGWTGGLARAAVLACDVCRPAVEAGILDEHFGGRLALTLLPFAAMLLAVAGIHLSLDSPRRRG